MHSCSRYTVAIVGNPNSGKSSVFNALTGLRQKVGNFPGVTVEKKEGQLKLSDKNIALVDLPGTYSFYPKREDEWVAHRYLMQCADTLDALIFTADATNIKRNLLLCSQIMDLHIPVIIVLTMMDMAQKKKIQIDIQALERQMGVPIVVANPRIRKGADALKRLLTQVLDQKNILKKRQKLFMDPHTYAPAVVAALRPLFPLNTPPYPILCHALLYTQLGYRHPLKEALAAALMPVSFNRIQIQAEEISGRYQKINQITQHCVKEKDPLQQKYRTQKLDNLLLHRRWGYVFLALILFLLFQNIFWIAQYPMDWVEVGLSYLEEGFISLLPGFVFSPAITNVFIGKLLFSGISATLVFVPQIMILSGLITILEDSGYMARISFLSDALMRQFGLNGKSLMPLISGMACAVPAIMAARNIENKKERLLTIFTLPFITCSARLPIFVMLTAILIPERHFFNWISLQGLVLMLLYIMGFVLSFITAFLLKFWIKTKEKSIFILELPSYKSPRWRNIGQDMLLKAKIFIRDVGKIIVVISVALTVLFSFVPEKDSVRIQAHFAAQITEDPEHEALYERQKNARLIQHSYAAKIGQKIEPLLTPLGYNWQIGVAVLASFAAREVFMGTLATVYSFEEDDLEDRRFLREKLAQITDKKGHKIFNTATGFSLLIFYMLAMQCMSTMAIVRRETGSWLWSLGQFTFMGALAYACSYMTYWLLK